ncbi:helix-turn-helix transcriptional regulator [Geobacter argillaceus]|uniref:DNA-binding NarL/FixJ family response regulator n=1 Tax=Geobacter argillaceus TaxID=345631 RepID=A0A562WR40_9BACT|nr:response regulator transcription factor [Geobacter argillaceus]TWJ32809.1 DNA-binding NarL/FixJ family response regulator [Geobacter argillaceus]
MERHSGNNRLLILINLTNHLLCQAVHQLLHNYPDEFRAQIAAADTANDDFNPDTILVDAITLARNPLARWPKANILLIDTGIEEERIINLLLTHRIDGVIAVDTDTDLFRKALFAVGSGQVWIDNGKLKALLSHVESIARNQRHETISKKEREIIVLISQGLRNREIAEKLSISEQTVKAHLSRIFRKTNVTSRSQLVPLALKFTT